jgi:hypothetical protein
VSTLPSLKALTVHLPLQRVVRRKPFDASSPIAPASKGWREGNTCGGSGSAACDGRAHDWEVRPNDALWVAGWPRSTTRVHCGLEIVPCTMTCSVRVAVEGYPRWADAVLGSIQGGGVQGALRAAAARCEVGETTTSCTSMARLVTSQPSPAGAPPDQQRVEIMPFEETAACSSQVDTCMPYHYVGWLVLSRTRGGA